MKSFFTQPCILTPFTLSLVLMMGTAQVSYAAEHEQHGEEHGHNDGHEEAASAKQTGSHGGKLFTDGHVSVELALIEDATPVYRAWITDEGKTVQKDATLNVQVTRLGGEVNQFTFTPSDDYWQGSGSVSEPHSFDVTVTLKFKGGTHSWQFESHEGRVQIKSAIAKQAGINSQIAGPGTIKKTLTVYGKAVADTSKISHIKARFAGIIAKVNVAIGDQVKKGQILAVIESNESLNRYNITAPFSGIITNRHAATGEQTQDQSLFTLANFDQVWAEFQIFPTQSQRIRAGQAVEVSLGDRAITSQLKHLIPSTNGQPFMIARALLDNRNGLWTPGLLVEGKVVVNKIQSPLVVNNIALQTLNDEPVVFITVGENYEARPLTLGLNDGTHTQVLDGLKVGDRYVVENSYLIKADLEKSGASHDH